MFGSIGVLEIAIIAAVGLMVLGPEKFPEVARMLARLVKDVRGYMDEAKQEIAKEIKPVQDELKAIKNVDTEKYLGSLIDGDEDDNQPPNPEPEGPNEDFYNPYEEEYPGMSDDRELYGVPAEEIDEEPEPTDPSRVEYGAHADGPPEDDARSESKSLDTPDTKSNDDSQNLDG